MFGSILAFIFPHNHRRARNGRYLRNIAEAFGRVARMNGGLNERWVPHTSFACVGVLAVRQR